jgi:hypothetical protein
MIIGIDYSMNSIGICIHNNNEYKFYSFINTYELSSAIEFDFNKNCNDKTKAILESIDGYTLFSRKPNSINKKIDKKLKNQELNRWHRQTLENSNGVANKILDFLCSLDVFNNNPNFVIENYITNRNGGDATIQIIEFTKTFKDLLLSKTDINNITIVTAPEIKMLAGNGNFTKQKMLESFVNENLEHKLYNLCSNNMSSFMKGSKDVIKPLDDIIDSYFLVKWFLNNN